MTQNYFPDNWVIIKVNGDKPFYKILAGWSGGYTSGTSWRMNSGIERAELKGDQWLFYGSSGSCYVCHKDSYCLRMNTAYVWEALKEKYGSKVEYIEEENWMEELKDYVNKTP